jgi:hypothetical protein
MDKEREFHRINNRIKMKRREWDSLFELFK